MLIRGGSVMHADAHFAPRDIRVDGDRIAEIAPGLQPRDGEDVIDASRRVVIPGLVNAHIHSNEALVRGLWDALPLEMWLSYAYPVTSAKRPDPEAVYVRTALGAIEHLRNGTTTV